jgi:hypothetical protein
VRGKDRGSVGCCGENRLRERGEILAGPWVWWGGEWSARKVWWGGECLG